MEEDFDLWFEREILAHDRALSRYVGRWVAAAEIPDIRQEVYVRVIQAAERKRPTYPRAFLMTVAKHLLIARGRRPRIVIADMLDKLDLPGALIDYVSPERSVSGEEEIVRLAECLDKLPTRRREAFWLRKVEELSQKEIAHQMGIEEGTVEQHLAGAMRQLTRCFNAEGQNMGRTGSRRLRPKLETEDGE